MIQDNALREMFASAVTEFDDNEIFIGELSRRLEKVEYLKRLQKEQKERYRANFVLAFASGALGMLAALFLLPLLPTDMQIIRSVLQTGLPIELPGNAKVLSTIFIIALSYWVLFSIRSIRRTA